MELSTFLCGLKNEDNPTHYNKCLPEIADCNWRSKQPVNIMASRSAGWPLCYHRAGTFGTSGRTIRLSRPADCFRLSCVRLEALIRGFGGIQFFSSTQFSIP